MKVVLKLVIFDGAKTESMNWSTFSGIYFYQLIIVGGKKIYD